MENEYTQIRAENDPRTNYQKTRDKFLDSDLGSIVIIGVSMIPAGIGFLVGDFPTSPLIGLGASAGLTKYLSNIAGEAHNRNKGLFRQYQTPEQAKQELAEAFYVPQIKNFLTRK